jgi:hypothetical protein
MTPARSLDAALNKSNTNVGHYTATDEDLRDNISVGALMSAGRFVFHAHFDVEHRCLSHVPLHPQQLRSSIVKAYPPFDGADKVFAMHEGNMTTLDAIMQLHVSGVLTRYQPIDRGRQMVKEFPDSKHGVLASMCLSHNAAKDGKITGSCINTTGDDSDCCTGDFDDGNRFCCHTCMVECSPFSDAEDANCTSCKDHSRHGNLNFTVNHGKECRNRKNTGSRFWRRAVLRRDCNAQDQREGRLLCLAAAEHSAREGYSNSFACMLSYVRCPKNWHIF